MHAAEDDEPSRKRSRYESEYSSSEDEYVLISALIGNITHGSYDWIIDSGASKHMIGFKESFVRLSEHESPHKEMRLKLYIRRLQAISTGMTHRGMF